MTIPLSAAYLLSGLCALVYETVWIYRFSRIFGSTVLSMSFVVAVFFAGLALGSRILGARSSRSPNPLRLYAFLELAIGGYALAFPFLIAGAERLYGGLYPAISGNLALLTSVRMLLSLALLIPPTVLMGGSLPVLLTCFTDRLAALGGWAGLVYGLNAVGAALGSFLSGYVLLEALGVERTNALAGMLNLAIGVLAWLLSWRFRPSTRSAGGETVASGEVAPPVGAETAGSARSRVALVMACFAVSGFVCMSYEVLWLRYLTFYFCETIYVYSGIITAFVLGIGLGSLVCGYLVSRIRCLVAFFGLLQAGIGLLTVLAVYVPIPLFQHIRDAGSRSGAAVFLILTALLILPAALMGATFPVVTRIIVPHLREVGDRVGRAYALNTLGGIVGLLASGFVLHGLLGMQMTLYLLLGVNLLLAGILFAADRGFSRPYLGAVPLIPGVAAVILIQSLDLRLPQALLRRPLQAAEQILEVREGPVGITWATKSSGGNAVYLWENGVRIGRGGRSTSVAQGYIPMLLAPRIPRDVLGLAFGGGLSYRAARLFPEVRRLDFVDISRENMDVALRQVPENEGLRDDPRARFIVDDAYSFVKYGEDRYDLILMEPTPPRYSYQTAALYTKEFYEFARRRLAEGGWFGQVLSLGDMSAAETASVMRTFCAVFPHRLLWKNGGDCLMLGGEREFHLDLRSICERLSRPEVQRTLREGAPLSEEFYLLDHFLAGLLLVDDSFRRAAEGGTVYTDDRAGLRFTTGRHVTTGNVRLIHEQLTPWADVRKLFDEFPGFEELEPRLAMNREYFMALLYKGEPREFHDVFLRYIEAYSLRKEADLGLLRTYLRERGLTEKAAEVGKMIEAVAKGLPE